MTNNNQDTNSYFGFSADAVRFASNVGATIFTAGAVTYAFSAATGTPPYVLEGLTALYSLAAGGVARGVAKMLTREKNDDFELEFAPGIVSAGIVSIGALSSYLPTIGAFTTVASILPAVYGVGSMIKDGVSIMAKSIKPSPSRP